MVTERILTLPGRSGPPAKHEQVVGREGSLNDLSGVPALLDRAGVMEVPRAKVAILDGTAHAPGQPWKHGKLVIHTLWGELAWQLGGVEGYDLVRAADTSGT